MNPITPLLAELNEIVAVYLESERRNELSGANFNAFNVCGIVRDEVRLHSRMLAELLDPRGRHGMGDRFLRLFLEETGVAESVLDYRKTRVWKEKYIGPKTWNSGGRIDLLITDESFAVLIEIKIYAPDEDGQMRRYYNYAAANFGQRFKAFYLTLSGNSPKDCSARDLREEDYTCISYSVHILNWLNSCLGITGENEAVRMVLSQYISVIKQLTKQKMDKCSTEKMLAQMTARENVLAVAEMMNLQQDWFDAVLQQYLWPELKHFAESIGLQFGQFDPDDSVCGFWFCRPEWKHYGIVFSSDRPNWKNMLYEISAIDESAKKVFKKDWKKLGCFDEAPAYDFPYGYSWFPDEYSVWTNDTVGAIVDGRLAQYIREKVTETLEAIEQEGVLL